MSQRHKVFWLGGERMPVHSSLALDRRDHAGGALLVGRHEIAWSYS
jgi:hypothetical protein